MSEFYVASKIHYPVLGCLPIDKFCKILAERGKNIVGMTNSIIKFKLKFIASPAAVKACAA